MYPPDPRIGLAGQHLPLRRLEELRQLQQRAAPIRQRGLLSPPTDDRGGLFSSQWEAPPGGLLSSAERDARRDGILAAGLMLLGGSYSRDPGMSLAQAGSAYLAARNQSLAAASQLGAQRLDEQRLREFRERLADPAWRARMGLTDQQGAALYGMKPEEAMKMLAEEQFAPAKEGKVWSHDGVLYDVGTGNVLIDARQDGWTPLGTEGKFVKYVDDKPILLDLGMPDQYKGLDELRNKFADEDQVKVWTTVRPILQTARASVNVDDAAADLNMIYGLAKAVDPSSVVRESEALMVREAGSPAQRLQGLWNWVQGGGRLSQAQRNQLMAAIERAAAPHGAAYNSVRSMYDHIASVRGFDKSQIFADHGTWQASADQGNVAVNRQELVDQVLNVMPDPVPSTTTVGAPLRPPPWLDPSFDPFRWQPPGRR